MRGKVKDSHIYGKAKGITPAHAGKSFFCPCRSCMMADHPRPCGEKVVPYHVRPSAPGSPPPMRGKAAFRRVMYVIVGITPAHAGKSFRRFCRYRQW